MIKYSVVIPTFNGSERILTPLYSLLRQTIPPEDMEIIIVNDGSTDSTEEVVREFKKNYPDRNIIYTRKNNKGPASARNVGVKYARGSIIFFTDDDCEPPALWMEKMIEIYEKHSDIAGVGGWYTPLFCELKTSCYQQFFHLLCRFDFGWGLDFFEGKTGGYSPLPSINGSNISFYAWVFKSIGEFDTRFRRPNLEDLEFSERVQSQGASLYYLQLHILHHKKMNYKIFIKECITRVREFKVYQKVRNKEYITLPSVWQRFRRFKLVYSKAENRNYGFHYKRRILFLALIWFFLLNFFTRILSLYSH